MAIVFLVRHSVPCLVQIQKDIRKHNIQNKITNDCKVFRHNNLRLWNTRNWSCHISNSTWIEKHVPVCCSELTFGLAVQEEEGVDGAGREPCPPLLNDAPGDREAPL